MVRISAAGHRKTEFFTLIELVVSIAIILLTVALVTAVFREESPSQQLTRAELDLKSYCARVRYRACESGRDQVVKFDLETKTFSAHPGEYEKFIMPGNSELSGRKQGDEDEGEEGDDPEAEDGYNYSKLEWKLPESMELATSGGEEDELMSGEKLEIFRFFPDGGGSGIGHLELKCGNLARIFRITKLTGRLSAIDKEEYERGLLE